MPVRPAGTSQACGQTYNKTPKATTSVTIPYTPVICPAESCFVAPYDGQITDDLSEEQDWQETKKTLGQMDEEEALLIEFVSKHPCSEKVPEALYFLAEHYEKIGEYQKAIPIYEQLLGNYPNNDLIKTALPKLVRDCYLVGDQVRYEQYLKLAVDPVSALPPITRDLMLFYQAENLRENDRADEARVIYQRLVKSLNGNVQMMAAGVLSGIYQQGEGDDTYEYYQKQKLELQYQRAIYVLYGQGDIDQAECLLKGIVVESAKVTTWDYKGSPRGRSSVMDVPALAEMALLDIGLRRINNGQEVRAFIEQLKAKGLLDRFCDYLGLDRQTLSRVKILPEEYLMALALNRCQDVREVRVVVSLTGEKVDAETKMPNSTRYFVYLSGVTWYRIEAGSTEGTPLPGKAWEASSETTVLSISLDDADLHKPMNKYWNKLNDLQQYSGLGKVFSPDKYKQILELLKIETNISGGQMEAMASIVRAYEMLPASHFSGLRSINTMKDAGGAAGYYSPKNQSVNLKNNGLGVVAHELTHSWDFESKGANGENMAEGDPSLLFYRISWDSWSEYARGSSWIEVCSDKIGQKQAACALGFGSGNGWTVKGDRDFSDFAEPYSFADGLEDLATSAESYVFGTGNLSRAKVREEMARGNFEPAAKYLFNKYIRSFDARDGYCYEYNITADNPPLSLKEVREAMAEWEKAHPGSISPNTQQVVFDIQATYLANREKAGREGL